MDRIFSICLQQKFPWIRDTKIKDRISVDPHIMKVMNDRNFDEVKEGPENTQWQAFRLTADNFVGRHKVPSYIELLQQMLQAHRMLQRNMMMTICSFHSHLDFSSQLSEKSEISTTKRFHHKIATMQKCNQKKHNVTSAGGLNQTAQI
jgi:hypothetical protein